MLHPLSSLLGAACLELTECTPWHYSPLEVVICEPSCVYRSSCVMFPGSSLNASSKIVIFNIEAAGNQSSEELSFFQQSALMTLQYLQVGSMSIEKVVDNAIINVFSSGHVMTAIDTTNATGMPLTVGEFATAVGNMTSINWAATGAASISGQAAELNISSALGTIVRQLSTIRNYSYGELFESSGGMYGGGVASGMGSGIGSGNTSETPEMVSGSYNGIAAGASCVLLAHSSLNITTTDISLSAAIREAGELFVVASLNSTTNPSSLVKLTGNSKAHVYLIGNSSDIVNTSEVLLTVASSGENSN